MPFKWIFIPLILVSTSCGGSSDLVKNPPFDILSTQKIPLGTRGFKITFSTSVLPRGLAFKKLYVDQRVAQVLWDRENTYYADFRLFSSDGEQMLSIDPKDEANNPVPVLPIEVPYSLEQNEALLQYSTAEGTFYTIFKVQ